MDTLDRLLPAIVDPAAPLITYYGPGGERVELSGTTTANWVAKTSNLLIDELEVEPGTRIRLALPTHWQRFVWLLSVWNVGAVVVDHDASIAVTGPDLDADEPVRLATALRPLGGPFIDPPQGFADLAVEVPGQGDHFLALDPPAATWPALDTSDAVATHAELLASARPDSRRLLVEPGSIARDAALIVSACAGRGSLVIDATGEAGAGDGIAAQEDAVSRST
ncbi:TIGR03089 family protein [Aeromicrobium sp. CF3.5]|uniref:TIGR03089 family protein n=1 Tax=Aeromicrobium sp. CF3.5 TaxID=3373078 RepID=UPI003EE43180